jgi:nicotinate-nucleotide adenylyltransferase
MRLGIYGGSFDPVHYGHLALARACQVQAALDEIWFTPTAVQPLKRHGPHASDSDRVEMLRLAIDEALTDSSMESDAWRVCTIEIERGGPSYTVDTLRQLAEELPDAQLFFLIGSDALRDVARWKEPDVIFSLATPLVVHRAGEAPPDLPLLASLCGPKTQPRVVEMQPVDVSSTEIRGRVANGQPIDGLMARSVAAYFANHGLYASSDPR